MAEKKKQLPESGAVFTVEFPFLRDTFTSADEDGPFEEPCWKPGATFGEDYMGRTRYNANGMGKQIITVVSVHQPGSFPTRVFYTRKWIDPDGRTFGKNLLKIKTIDAFRRLVRGYAFPLLIEDTTPKEKKRLPVEDFDVDAPPGVPY